MRAVFILVTLGAMTEACNQNFWNSFLQPTTTTTTTTTQAPNTVNPSSCTCGRANRINKIVGGNQAGENEYPWQVGVLSSSGDRRPFCGGSLISSKEVLTAAHCTQGNNARYVVLGEHMLFSNDGQKVVRVCNVIDSPRWSSSNTNYDFSILRLCEDVPFQKEIMPVCLPSSASNNYDNRQAVVSGWGSLSSGGFSPSTLYEVTVNTMSNAQCQGSSTDYPASAITSAMLCAGASGKDSCQGDSGGPLVTKEGSSYTLIGVVSWGYGCADARAPGVYARVTKELSWINSNIQGRVCGSKSDESAIQETPEGSSPTG